MTRDEAIKELKNELLVCENPCLEYQAPKDALKMAIKALEEVPYGDCISRQAALNAIIKELCIKDENYLLQSEKTIYDVVKNIPSVNPQEPKTGWIPTSERNPDLIKKLYADGEVTFTYYQSDRVLLQTKSDMLIGTYYKDAAVSPHYETDDGYIIASRVIAWRPLPEPMKVGEENC